ncbi:class I SAM-dependent DNA methyltransferase [Massilia glaciei]|nr:class I SAM-dependent methyltransferase [Massilia glaciei]
MQPIHDYYDKLAKDYDRDRFDNSYGRYIDQMERQILRRWLGGTAPAGVLDVGCGTGRLLEFAMSGVDASRAMLDVAASKFPDRLLRQARLPDLGAPLARYDAAICFHVFMHLDQASIAQSLAAIAGQVRAGGVLIVDIPSRHRRAMNRRRPSQSGWHGDTAATGADMARWAGPAWRIAERRGILFFPIHRLPSFARPLLRGLDRLIGCTWLARYASYHVYRLERQP